MDVIKLDANISSHEINGSTTNPLSTLSSTIDNDFEEGEVDPEEEEKVQNLIISIKFKNIKHFHELHKKILTALNNVLPSENYALKVVNNDTKDAGIDVFSIETSAEDAGAATTDVDASVPVDMDLFQIDTAPAVKLETCLIPSYKRTIREGLDEDTLERKKHKKDDDVCERPKNQNRCFNCGETGHSIRDCPEPRNESRIKRAKKQHANRNERYHADMDQRFAHLKPGQISNAARNALGLQRGELPFFYYRMRIHGYPPAWLEDAKVESSGIALFNADGSEVLKSDDEEQSASAKYDVSKIIEFPGFNVQPGSKYYDDYKHHNVPPIQRHQMKAEFIKSLGQSIIKGYKRKKLKNLPSAHNVDAHNLSATANLSVDDMEIVNDSCEEEIESKVEYVRPPMPTEPPPKIELPLPPASPSPPPINTSKRMKSPTLEDLQVQQEQLLEQLQANVSLDKTATISEGTPNQERVETQLVTDEPTTPTTSKYAEAIFKESHLGTPILKFSPYDKLPTDDKFKVGVSDVINFENLPDSTGKYEQMKEVIKNVRKTIIKLQNEDD